MLKFLRKLTRRSEPEDEFDDGGVAAENPLDAALRRGKPKRKEQRLPSNKRETLEVLEDPSLEVQSDGSDPYNSTGGFDRRSAWQRVNKR